MKTTVQIFLISESLFSAHQMIIHLSRYESSYIHTLTSSSREEHRTITISL